MSDLLNKRFVRLDEQLWDRDNEKDHIQQAFQLLHQENGVLYFFHGLPGVGKSSLCEYTKLYVQTQLEIFYSFIDIDVSKTTTIEQLVQRFYRELTLKNELSFPRYEVASDYLFRITNDPVYKIEKENTVPKSFEIISNASNDILALLSVAVRQSTSELAFSLAEIIVNKVLSLGEAKLDKYFKEKAIKENQKVLECFIEKLNCLSISEIKRNLWIYFLEDLNQSLTLFHKVNQENKYRLIITIDSFEQRNNSNDMNQFFFKLFDELKYATWFLFTTEPSFPFDTTQNLILHDLPVKSFTLESLKKYLNKKGIREEAKQKEIFNASEGLPAAIKIILSLYQNGNNSEFQKDISRKGYKELFNQYFRKHLTDDMQSMLMYLSLFDTFNQDVLSFAPSLGNAQTIFMDIIKNTALVASITDEKNITTNYRLIGIAKKSLLSTLENDSATVYQKVCCCKYKYEKSEIKNMLDKNSMHINQEFYVKLQHHCKEAFYYGLLSYSTENEFNSISNWCTETQQNLTAKALFGLKAELTKMYLEVVGKKDDFKYDAENDPTKRFRFRNMRDHIWACRFSKGGRETVLLAGRYANELLTKFGIHSSNVPFALYLWGLTFQDVGEYPTAYWLFKQGLFSNQDDNQDPEEVKSPFPAVVYNAIGCLDMDQKNFKSAKKYLLTSKKKRSENDFSGMKTIHNNLSKLYFRWAQELLLDNTKENSEAVRRYIKKSIHNLDCAEWFLKKMQKKSSEEISLIRMRRIVLDILNSIYSDAGKINTQCLVTYFDELEEIEETLLPNNMLARKIALAIKHNKAIIYAYQYRLSDANNLLISCKKAASKIYLDLDIESNVAKNKPALKELHENSLYIEQYVKRGGPNFDLRRLKFQFV